MYDALAQTMIDPSQMQQTTQQPQMAMQQPAPMAPPTVPYNPAAYQMGPPVVVAPSAPDSFLHHLGKALQSSHAGNGAQGADAQGSGGNPYAISFNSISDSVASAKAARAKSDEEKRKQALAQASAGSSDA